MICRIKVNDPLWCCSWFINLSTPDFCRLQFNRRHADNCTPTKSAQYRVSSRWYERRAKVALSYMFVLWRQAAQTTAPTLVWFESGNTRLSSSENTSTVCVRIMTTSSNCISAARCGGRLCVLSKNLCSAAKTTLVLFTSARMDKMEPGASLMSPRMLATRFELLVVLFCDKESIMVSLDHNRALRWLNSWQILWAASVRHC
jgi:hypothetical protein